MPNAIKWDAAPTSRGNVLSTELNSLANNALTAVGTELDNGTNLDQYGIFELTVTFGSAPSAGGYVNIWRAAAPGGTNYPLPTGTSESLEWVCARQVDDSTSAQRIVFGPVVLPGEKQKFVLENKTGVSFPASGSTLAIYTQNDEVQ